MTAKYLETWFHNIIRNLLKHDGSFLSFSGRSDSRGDITERDLTAYRDFNLRRTVRYAYERSAFYRDMFDRNLLNPDDIDGVQDLARIPFTDQSDIARFPYRFLCTSQSAVFRPRVFVTSGTTGPRKEIFWSNWDTERITDFMAAGIGTVAEPDDTVQILLPDDGPDSQADLLRRGVEKLGARPVISGVMKSAEEQLEILEKFHSTVIFGYTGYIYRISKKLELQQNLRSRGVKVLFLAGEYLPAARRRKLEDLWCCGVRTHYGLTEMGLGVAVECDSGDGYHFNEADLLLEIVDPASGENVPAGKEGELVFTTLTREAMPLLRYRTRDISSCIETSCTCGVSSLQKFGPVRKRVESIVVLQNGMDIYPAAIEDVLYSFTDVIDYHVKLVRHNSRDRLDFTVEVVRCGEDLRTRIAGALYSMNAVAENVRIGAMSAPEVNLVCMGGLKSPERSKKLIADCR